MLLIRNIFNMQMSRAVVSNLENAMTISAITIELSWIILYTKEPQDSNLIVKDHI
jgi:hypothetical protein